MRRRIRAATAWSWVITMIVVPGGVELFQQGQDRRAGGRVQVAGRLVGQHHRRRGPRSPGRSPPAAARRPTAGSAGRRPGAPARPGPARQRPAGAARPRRTPAYSSPSATLSSTLWCSARKNCWNTNPIRVARSADSSRSVIRATSRPVTRTVPLVGRSRVPIRCSSVVLPDPDGPTTAASSPAATARLTSSSARTGGDPGYTFVTRSSSSTGAPPAPRAAGAHVAGTTTRCAGRQRPGHLHQAGGVVEDPGRHRHQRRVFPAPATSTAYPPGGLGQQRRHRHRQHVRGRWRW